MKKAKRKYNRPKHKGTAFFKSAKMIEAEKIKQLVVIPPHRLQLDYVKPKRFT